MIEDIQHTGAKSIFFGDSDFGGKRARAMELMEAMIPLKVRWSALWTSNLCSDAEYMDLAKRSGLLHLNIGIESINEETLLAVNSRLSLDNCLKQLHVVTPENEVLVGWDAVACLARLFPATCGCENRLKQDFKTSYLCV